MMIKKEILEGLRAGERRQMLDGWKHGLEPRQGPNASGRLITLTHAIPSATPTTLASTSTSTSTSTSLESSSSPPAPPQTTASSLSQPSTTFTLPKVTPTTSPPPPPPPPVEVPATPPAVDVTPSPSVIPVSGAPSSAEGPSLSPVATTSGMDAGAIIGVIILVLTGIAILIAAIFFVKKCMRSESKPKPNPRSGFNYNTPPSSSISELASSTIAARTYPAAATQLDALAANVIARPPMARAFPDVAGQLDALAARARMRRDDYHYEEEKDEREQLYSVTPQELQGPGFGRLVIANQVPEDHDDEEVQFELEQQQQRQQQRRERQSAGAASSFYYSDRDSSVMTPIDGRPEWSVYEEVPVIPQEFIQR